MMFVLLVLVLTISANIDSSMGFCLLDLLGGVITGDAGIGIGNLGIGVGVGVGGRLGYDRSYVDYGDK